MAKFTGGRQTGKLMCLARPCQSDSQEEVRIVDEVDCVDLDDDDDNDGAREGTVAAAVAFEDGDLIREVKDRVLGRRRFFRLARVRVGTREFSLRPGDFVLVRPDMGGVPHFVAQVLALSEEPESEARKGKRPPVLATAHVRWMCRSIDTVLGCDSEDEKWVRNKHFFFKRKNPWLNV